MKNFWKKTWRFLQYPPAWLTVCCCALLIAAVACSLVFVCVPPTETLGEILSYVCYAFSAILLGYVTYIFVRFAPALLAKIKAWLHSSPLTKRLVENFGFRTVLFAGFSALFNVAYALFNGAIAIYSLSVWYGALSAYYLMLTFMRGGLVLYHRKRDSGRTKREEEVVRLRKCRTCGVLLVLLPICLSFAILEMVTSGKAFVRMDWTVYAVAAYTFYKITMAIVNSFKSRNDEDVTVSALRVIGIADALVSVLALQTSLLYAFGDGINTGIPNAVTGAFVCAATLALGVIIIVVTKRREKRLTTKKEEENERTE